MYTRNYYVKNLKQICTFSVLEHLWIFIVCIWLSEQNWYGPLSYVRAASQIRVINGVSEVESQPNTLCSKWAENIFADRTGQHRESIWQQWQSKFIHPFIHVVEPEAVCVNLSTKWSRRYRNGMSRCHQAFECQICFCCKYINTILFWFRYIFWDILT